MDEGEVFYVPTEYPGERLRALREARGLGVRELARMIGLSAATVSLVENGKRRWTPEVERRLRAVGITGATP